jgi:selenide,water dikinase
MGPAALAQVLRPLADLFRPQDYPNLLVGLGQPDDAAVYRLNDEQALITTTDFFPPVVDDPYAFGAIAAANAISDVYAMGGEPLFAVNLAAFPEDLDMAILSEILRGGAEKVKEAGAVVAGGHTVTDREPKYGLAVTGLVHPQRIWTKGGARTGDALVLTKPLGTGAITTAIKRDLAAMEDVRTCIASMARLNRAAARAAAALEVHGATDVTGFGLLGHAHEVAHLAGLRLRLHWQALPWLPGALRHGSDWVFPGGAARNQDFYSQWVTFGDGLADWQRMLLFDPQTSGGLLLALNPAILPALGSAMEAAGQPYWVIGEAMAGPAGTIEVA